jgi:hypothetical protein
MLLWGLVNWGGLWERIWAGFSTLELGLLVSARQLHLQQKQFILKMKIGSKWRHDAQHNDTEHVNIQHNDIQHNETQFNETEHEATQHNATCHNDAQHKDTQRKNIKNHIRHK